MVLTTLPLRLRKTAESTTRHSLLFRSIGLGIMVLLLPLLTACGDGGNSGDATALANPGNGHAYGRFKFSPSPTSSTTSTSTTTSTATISMSPTALAISAVQGGSDPAAQTVTIANSGTGTLDWSVTTTAGWLLLSSLSGTAPGSFTATAIVAGLAAGTYSTTITVTAVGTTNTTQSIPVDLTISASTSSSSTSTSTTSTSPSTATVSLAWDPVQDPTVTGYYVHYGLQSPNSAGSCAYSQSSFSSSPATMVTGLAPNTTYYFSVSAYNGLESKCSSEVSTFTQAT